MAIKLNSKLKKFSDFDPTKESIPMSIGALCNAIEKKEITLPIFQTYLRWQIEKCVSLLNFQLLGKAAVSPISINRIKDEKLAVKQVSFIDRTVLEDVHGKLSVNDGQQRLSTNFLAYIDAEEFRCIVLDLTIGKFVINESKLKKSQIPVGKLYNRDSSELEKYVAKHKELQEFEVYTLLMKIRSKFLGYYYTVNFANDLTEDEQVEWFEVLNLAGSRVPYIQMKLTQLLVKGVDFYLSYSNVFKEKLDEAGLELFGRKDSEVSTPLACLNPAYEVITNRKHISNYSPIPSDTRENKICELSAKDVVKCFDITLAALDRTLEFIELRRLKKPDRIDYITYLTGLFVYLGEEELTENQQECIVEWYNSVLFTNKSNQERREMFDQILDIKNKK